MMIIFIIIIKIKLILLDLILAPIVYILYIYVIKQCAFVCLRMTGLDKKKILTKWLTNKSLADNWPEI